jgi:pyruvate formate lyase activating enzyme
MIRHVSFPALPTTMTSYTSGDFLKTLRNIERIDILPYHTLGVYKNEKLGIDYPLRACPSPTDERVAYANSIMADVPLAK